MKFWGMTRIVQNRPDGSAPSLPWAHRGDRRAATNSTRETPSVEMPPLTLMVLDAVADDWESIESMRNHGEVAPYGLALVDHGLIVDAVRSLLSDRLIEAADVAEDPVRLVPVLTPQTDEPSLRRYWFRPTDAGKQVWRDGHDVLDAYWNAHPPGRRSSTP
jgi:hypothetical protein